MYKPVCAGGINRGWPPCLYLLPVLSCPSAPKKQMVNVFFFFFTNCTLYLNSLAHEPSHSASYWELLVNEKPSCRWVPGSCSSSPYSLTPFLILHLPKQPLVAFLDNVSLTPLPLASRAVYNSFNEEVLYCHQIFPMPTTVRWSLVVPLFLLFKVSPMHPFGP